MRQGQQRELQIFRNVRFSPFFHHHLSNNLRYFSERMVETSLAFRNLTEPGQVIFLIILIILLIILSISLVKTI